MAPSRQAALSVAKEAEAQDLAQRLRELADEELVAIARLLVSKPEHETFGNTEFELRALVLQLGAQALEEHLRLKKTATTAPASIVPSVSKPPISKVIEPSRS